VLEGLLPAPHGDRLLRLLYVFAQWHGLAKLRLHTEHTVALLDDCTTQLGQELREFVDKTCSTIATKELAREYAARTRHESRKKSKTSVGSNPRSTQPAKSSKGKSKEPARDQAPPKPSELFVFM
jgi:hypothetical protein